MSGKQAAVLGVVALLLTGCAHASDPAAQTGNGMYGPQVMVPRDDLVSPMVPVRWKSWRAVDDTTIEVTYFAGPASCQGVHALAGGGPGKVGDLDSGVVHGAPGLPAYGHHGGDQVVTGDHDLGPVHPVPGLRRGV